MPRQPLVSSSRVRLDRDADGAGVLRAGEHHVEGVREPRGAAGGPDDLDRLELVTVAGQLLDERPGAPADHAGVVGPPVAGDVVEDADPVGADERRAAPGRLRLDAQREQVVPPGRDDALQLETDHGSADRRSTQDQRQDTAEHTRRTPQLGYSVTSAAAPRISASRGTASSTLSRAHQRMSSSSPSGP